MDEATVDRDGRELLERFIGAVARSPHNLVSRTDRDRLWERHIVDCLAFARRLPDGPLRLLDVGTGGGFPGVVIAIVRPDIEVHLLEATRKKVGFLDEVVADLGLAVSVHGGRAEDLGKGPLRASFDVVTARAVAPLDRLVPWLTPFLLDDGVIMAMKGERWREELDQARVTLRREGLMVVSTPEQEVDLVDERPAPPARVVMLARSGWRRQ